MMQTKISSCYVCTTPYQIITSISDACDKQGTADLYIVPQFSAAEEYCEKVAATGVFRKVTVVDTTQIEAYKKEKQKLKVYLGIAKNYLKIDKLVEAVLLPDTVYENIYISSKANIGRLICLYYLKNNIAANTFYFDDGEGSYNNPLLYEPKKADALLRKLLFGSKSIKLSNTMYLYSPALFRAIHPDSPMEIRPLANWSGDAKKLDMINSVCGFSAEKGISERFILIDTIADEAFRPEVAGEYERICEKISEICGQELIFKKHPRDKSVSDTAHKVYPYHSVPFEVICANSSIGEKVLITAASTAVAVPKMIFDSEPTVILLYQLLDLAVGSAGGRDSFYSAIAASYNEKDKFFIPRTESELYCYLQHLMQA